MKHFCTACGKPTIYSTTLPKFCSECGGSFTVSTPNQDKSAYDKSQEALNNRFRGEASRVPIRRSGDEDYYGEDEDLHIDPSLFASIKPKFTIELHTNKPQSFESIISNAYASNYKPISPSELREGVPIRDVDKESVLSDFQREAGAVRQD